MRRLTVQLGAEAFPRQPCVRLAARDGLDPLSSELDVLHRGRIDAGIREDRVDDRLPADRQHGDLLAGELRGRRDLAVAGEHEVEDLGRILLPDADDRDSGVDRGREDARGRVAHVDLLRSDELHLARSGAGVELDVDVELLVVPHLYGDADVVVVHDVESPARRDPTDQIELVRPRERLLGRSRSEQPETETCRGGALDQVSPRQPAAVDLVQSEVVFHASFLLPSLVP